MKRTADLTILKALHFRNLTITNALLEFCSEKFRKVKNLNIAARELNYNRPPYYSYLENVLELGLKVDIDSCTYFPVPSSVEDLDIHCSSKNNNLHVRPNNLTVNTTCNQQFKDVKLFCDPSFRGKIILQLPKGDHCIPNFTCNAKSTQIEFVADSYDCLSCFRNVKIHENFIFRISVRDKIHNVRLPKSTTIKYFEDGILRPMRWRDNQQQQLGNPQNPRVQKPCDPKPLVQKPWNRKPLVQEPLIQEPLVQKPWNRKPLIQEPLIQEPLVQKPWNRKPLIQEPLVQKPWNRKPLVQKPLIQESLIQEPLVQKPWNRKPLVQEPLIQEPLIQESLIQEPLIQEPLIQESLIQEPLIQKPLVQKPWNRKPLVQEPRDPKPCDPKPSKK